MMEDYGRLVSAPLSIEFNEGNFSNKEFKREYDSMGESDDDPIGQWLKLAKARGETRDSDSVVLHLVVELHRKIDELRKIVKDEIPEFLKLESSTQIEGVGYGIFKLVEPLFEEGVEYYGRINMPTFPQRTVPIFFEGLDKFYAKVLYIHDRDQKDWDGYIVARERALIRELKRQKEK